MDRRWPLATPEAIDFEPGTLLRSGSGDKNGRESVFERASWRTRDRATILAAYLTAERIAKAKNLKLAITASAAVVLLTVGKVFLLDMSGLTGFWHALSFIGLGLALVGIGYLYPRLLFPHDSASAPTPSQAALWR